jgi:putative transcriptional regulator
MDGGEMSKFGDDLIASLTEAVAHARGDPNGVKVHVIDVPDIKAIRHQLNMSQEIFAVTYRIPLATLKNWEQGRRQPDAPAMAYLTAISRKPVEIGEALKN